MSHLQRGLMTEPTQFTCFTTQFTCFTSARVPMLTPEELRQALAVTVPLLQVLSLLALLVHKYKY